jgi:hypothetical protein
MQGCVVEGSCKRMCRSGYRGRNYILTAEVDVQILKFHCRRVIQNPDIGQQILKAAAGGPTRRVSVFDPKVQIELEGQDKPGMPMTTIPLLFTDAYDCSTRP